MTTSDSTLWLYLFLFIYGAIVLYWARQAALMNKTDQGFFTADKSLTPWMTALGITGASISGWIVLGFPQAIATQGLGFGVLALAGIIIPITGVLFFKRQWELATRYNFTTQSQLLSGYFGGRSIGIVSALISVIFAIGFSGLQLRAVGNVLATISEAPQDLPLFIWGMVALIAAYVVIGGMRSVGYLSMLQTVLIALSLSGLGLFVLIDGNGFPALNEQLALIASDPSHSAKGFFEVAGIIQFTAGLGIEQPLGGQWTSVMIMSTALSLLGIQASPMITQLVLSTRSSTGFAAGQTWVFAAFFGGLIAFFIVLIGVSGLSNDGNVLSSLLLKLSQQSPWFTATIALGLIAAVQIVCGLSLLSAAHTLIKDIYVPFYHKGLGVADQVLFGRVCIVILLIVSALMASFSPVALSAIGSMALPSALQLWPALIGLCWFKFISRQAVITGAVIGIFAVFSTETLGIAVFNFLGLELPWGRWPWTVHSGTWGLFFNLIAVVVISAVTKGRGHAALASEMRLFLLRQSGVSSASRGLKPAAWSAVLAWFFLAIGPGVVLGNQVFGAPSEGIAAWTMGMPSLWAWILIFWVLGVFLVWFLSFKMNLATSSALRVTPLELPLKGEARNKKIQESELIRLMWTAVIAASVVTLTAWVFGS